MGSTREENSNHKIYEPGIRLQPEPRIPKEILVQPVSNAVAKATTSTAVLVIHGKQRLETKMVATRTIDSDELIEVIEGR